MIQYMHMKINEVQDHDFQSMIDELCECVCLDRNQISNQSFAFLLMAISREEKEMNLKYLLNSKTIERKVHSFALNSAVYLICCELVRLKKSHIEIFDKKSVFGLRVRLKNHE